MSKITIESEGAPHSTKVFVDGREVMNVQKIDLTIDVQDGSCSIKMRVLDSSIAVGDRLDNKSEFINGKRLRDKYPDLPISVEKC